MSLWDDMQADELCAALEAPAAKRKNEWSNVGQFVSDGYLARVLRQTCRSCKGRSEHTQGIFHVERKEGAKDRRLTALGRGAQWPLSESLPLEVEEVTVDWCPACLRLIGFDVERPAIPQTGFVFGLTSH